MLLSTWDFISFVHSLFRTLIGYIQAAYSFICKIAVRMWKYIPLPKIPKFHLLFWFESFVETHNFRRILCNLARTLRKLRVSTNFPRQKICQNYGSLCSAETRFNSHFIVYFALFTTFISAGNMRLQTCIFLYAKILTCCLEFLQIYRLDVKPSKFTHTQTNHASI